MKVKPVKNKITISLPFSFKGETFRPRCIIDLDKHMEQDSIPCLYTYLADENGIDVYSYEHDVMMMGVLVFEAGEGMAAEFIQDGQFDSEGFETKWKEQKLDNLLQDIVSRCMGEAHNLEQQPDLKQAMTEAYQLGKKRSS